MNRNMASSYNRTGREGGAKLLISKSARILANSRQVSGASDASEMQSKLVTHNLSP
jgi:hypothetical protein